MALKVVLIGPRGTVFKDGQAQTEILNDLVLFIRRMHATGVHVGLWSQHPASYRQQELSEPVETFLSRQSGTNVPFYRANYGVLPARRSGGSVIPILKQLKVESHEVILVGNDTEDMLAGVNNKLLLLRPEWYRANPEYRFCRQLNDELRGLPTVRAEAAPNLVIDHESLQMRSMGPFSTYRPDFAIFGSDARNVAKHGFGERHSGFG